jgi:hypothetical protein
MHLLKWKFQPERSTIRGQRAEIEALFEFAPSLRRAVEENIPRAYARAVSDAADETRLPKSGFPPTCPFTPNQILDDEYFPE